MLPLPTARQTILKNRDMDFKVDPNGFVTAVPPQPREDKEAATAAKRSAAAALEESTSSIGDRLLATVGSSAAAAADAAAAAAAAAGAAAAAEAAAEAAADPLMVATKKEFLLRYGAKYGYGGRIDALYPSEVRFVVGAGWDVVAAQILCTCCFWPRALSDPSPHSPPPQKKPSTKVGCRMGPHEHYLDYTGSSVYANSQLDAIFKELRTHLFGNPHSANPSSTYASEHVEEARDLVLKWVIGVLCLIGCLIG